MTTVSGIDLNLLAALGALLEERNLTRAGARLNLTQPAMSAALTRLRQHFGDELLVRSGRQFVLTPDAERVLPAVQHALQQVDRTFAATGEFDAANSTRAFSIAISGQSIVTLSGLLRRAHELAPGVRLDLRPVPAEAISGDRGLLQHDLVIAPLGIPVLRAPPKLVPPPEGTLEIVEATYGGSCKATEGNVTKSVVSSCSGNKHCNYVVDVYRLGDPASGCAKDFDVRWRCGRKDAIKVGHIEAEAGVGGKSVLMQCDGSPLSN